MGKLTPGVETGVLVPALSSWLGYVEEDTSGVFLVRDDVLGWVQVMRGE